MPVAKKAYVSDGVNWIPLVSGVPDMAGYATTEYVDEFIPSISVSASPPAAPEQGQFWFDTDTNELFVYDSVYWIEVSGTAVDLAEYLTIASASTQYEKLIPYSSSTPSTPATGDLWVDSSTSPPALKTYNGSLWVQLGSAVDDPQAIIASSMFMG